ncbi:MAG TPA: cytochrome c3 family protein [Planctomycetota bacterium]|nr:cytochrome c3 family protein [Planctomycetota bacterium]
MTRRKSFLILIVFAATVLVLAGMEAVAARSTAIQQPIRFDHARHMKEDMKCNQCHTGVDNSPYATLPPIRTCLLCHKEAKGTDPEEAKIREYAKNGTPIPWVQVNRLVGHVYFSHGMHVKVGKLDCKECHGEMAQADQPVGRSQIGHLTMDRCMECHEEKHVNQECLTCHK